MWQALWHDGMPLVQWGVVIGASLAAAVWDLTKRRIPNVLTGTLLASALVFAPVSAGLAGLVDAISASLILATPYLLLFLFAGGGAGDAKLMGGIGAWLGIVNGLIALFSVAIVGTFVAVGFSAALRRRSRLKKAAKVENPPGGPAQRPEAGAENGDDKGLAKIPFGLAICIGVCIAACGVLIWRT